MGNNSNDHIQKFKTISSNRSTVENQSEDNSFKEALIISDHPTNVVKGDMSVSFILD